MVDWVFATIYNYHSKSGGSECYCCEINGSQWHPGTERYQNNAIKT